MRRLLLDDDGKLRPLLRAILFWVVGNYVLLPYVFEKAVLRAADALGLPGASARNSFFYTILGLERWRCS
jgi:hypothetical protein